MQSLTVKQFLSAVSKKSSSQTNIIDNFFFNISIWWSIITHSGPFEFTSVLLKWMSKNKLQGVFYATSFIKSF